MSEGIQEELSLKATSDTTGEGARDESREKESIALLLELVEKSLDLSVPMSWIFRSIEEQVEKCEDNTPLTVTSIYITDTLSKRVSGARDLLGIVSGDGLDLDTKKNLERVQTRVSLLEYVVREKLILSSDESSS